MPPRTKKQSWDEGAAAVEGAIVIAILIAMIFGVIEFGRAVWQWNTVMLAVQEAGRYVMIHKPCSASCAEGQMQDVLGGAGQAPKCTLSGGGAIMDPTPGNICVYATPPTSTMTLTAIYAFSNVIVPADFSFGFFSGPFTVRSEATFPLP
jgi:Flp pilus assembly protein TadG